MTAIDLSIVLPTVNERQNIERLIPELIAAARRLNLETEIVVVDGGSTDGTVELAARLGARVLEERSGYGEAIRTGLESATGLYIITMDADLSHEPKVLDDLWAIRDPQGIGIASRYVEGGGTSASLSHRLLSRTLNAVLARGLSLQIKDMTNGYRIYPGGALETLRPRGRDFDVLPEILTRAHLAGWRLVEIPCRFAARTSGNSKRRYLRFLVAYVRTFARLWLLRTT